MAQDFSLSMFDLVLCLSQAVDFVCPVVNEHHKRVAYIATQLADELRLPLHERKQITLAAALHDIGGLSMKCRCETMRFEIERPHDHARIGYSLLRTLSAFDEVATLVRFHHVPWANGAGAEFEGRRAPMGSHLIHLADRTAVLIRPEDDVLSQAPRIVERIAGESGRLFMPDLVEVFRGLADKEYFWFDAVSPSVDWTLRRGARWETTRLGDQSLLELTHLFRRVIDFRSPFTAGHSNGVAACAQALAEWSGFSRRECSAMVTAGHLHDLGKLAVPREILEKRGKLNKGERNIIRHHAYYTDRILKPIEALDVVRDWAAHHHERLDGTGYPFHLKAEALTLGARIMAVADVFTALTEDRPYRKGMSWKKTMTVLERMAAKSALDSAVVEMVRRNYDDLQALRAAAQDQGREEYHATIEPFVPS